MCRACLAGLILCTCTYFLPVFLIALRTVVSWKIRAHGTPTLNRQAESSHIFLWNSTFRQNSTFYKRFFWLPFSIFSNVETFWTILCIRLFFIFSHCTSIFIRVSPLRHPLCTALPAWWTSWAYSVCPVRHKNCNVPHAIVHTYPVQELISHSLLANFVTHRSSK